MMPSDDTHQEVTASISDGSVTLEMTTRYGPISFSYSPQAIETGISQLVSEALSESDAYSTLRDLLTKSDLPANEVRARLEHYRRSQETKFPDDAIEKFTPGNRAHVQGTRAHALQKTAQVCLAHALCSRAGTERMCK